jgi:anti-sigma B factor antagonist
MEFPTDTAGDKGFIKVTADLDSEQSGDALRRAFEKLEAEGKKTMILDLSDVRILNSYGIGKILICHQALKEKNGVLMVKRPTGFVKEVFELLMLDKLLPAFDG